MTAHPPRIVPSATAADASRRGNGRAPSVAAPGAASLPAGKRRPALDARGWLTLVAWVVGTVAAGSAIALVASPDSWYAALAKPTWTPPDGVFAPVWTAVYACIGLAAWVLTREVDMPAGERRLAWTAFWMQAVLNLAWSPLLFALHAPGLAFLDICLLWLVTLATTLLFGRIRPLAGYLMAPHVLWVGFALVLNGTIWLMNP